MGAGILPATILNNELYFLFGKENQFETSAPGFSDFGGGTDPGETYFQTAIREGSEELTGFLGDQKDLKKMLKQTGTYNIEHATPNVKKIYSMFIFPMEYDPKLVYYYNNNQRFLQKRLEPEVIKKTKIFEKAEIRWISVREMVQKKSIFRPFFLNMIERLDNEKENIKKFIESKLNTKIKNKNKNNKTVKKRK
jgi:8-oxo-dGTP pyrophosphatase MutT (NUDIX family)